MTQRRLSILLALIVLLVTALACGGSFSTANITDARMTTDDSGDQSTTIYGQNDTFFAIVEVANAPSDTTLEAVWTAVNVEGEEPNLEIDRTEITVDDRNIFTFNLSNNQPWPTGTYEVDLFLNGELDRTLTFEVQ